MKTFWTISIFLTFSVAVDFGQADEKRPKLPLLDTIKTVTLSPSYSCRSHEEFQKGYAETALFLSSSTIPALLFNGGCNAEDYLQSDSNDSMSLVADLGDNVPLEDVTPQNAFNWKNLASFNEYSRFVKCAKVIEGHTYAVLINGSDRRGLVIVTVDRHVPNKRIDLRYAVKYYQLMEKIGPVTPQIIWNKKSTP